MLPAEMRKFFFAELLKHLKVVWPILSVMIGAMVASGFVVCKLEQWPLRDGIYFAFISGLTIGYGDLTPLHPVSRALAIMTGFVGILNDGLSHGSWCAGTGQHLEPARQNRQLNGCAGLKQTIRPSTAPQFRHTQLQ